MKAISIMVLTFLAGCAASQEAPSGMREFCDGRVGVFIPGALRETADDTEITERDVFTVGHPSFLFRDSASGARLRVLFNYVEEKDRKSGCVAWETETAIAFSMLWRERFSGAEVIQDDGAFPPWITDLRGSWNGVGSRNMTRVVIEGGSIVVVEFSCPLAVEGQWAPVGRRVLESLVVSDQQRTRR
jgi:hypothetical protein